METCETFEPTHKGWFWACPIYLSPDNPACPVVARAAWLEWLFTACEILERARIFLTSLLVRDYEPTFMFRVTGPAPAGTLIVNN